MATVTFTSVMARLTTRQKLVLAGTGASVVLILLIRFLYLPVLGTIGERRAILKDLRVKIADVEVLRAQQAAHEAALVEAEVRYRDLKSWISRGESMPRILEALSRQARDDQVELVVLQPPAAEGDAQEASVFTLRLRPGLELRQVPLHLTLTGRFFQIGEFLGTLADMPFVVSVQSIRVTKPEISSAKLRVEVVLPVFLTDGASGT